VRNEGAECQKWRLQNAAARTNQALILELNHAASEGLSACETKAQSVKSGASVTLNEHVPARQETRRLRQRVVCARRSEWVHVGVFESCRGVERRGARRAVGRSNLRLRQPRLQ